jgi:NAD(P)-dependent dehydrogenase (short-subunit alcohol dehydrogenase family)
MLQDLFSMKDKVCVVTGGSRGLGRAMAEAYLKAGAARIYITARKAEACEQAAKELSSLTDQGECVAIPCNLSTADEIERFANAIAEREQAIDVLVNNAGAAWEATLEQFPEKGWDKVMDLNTKTPFFLTQKLLPLLKAAASASGDASVINTGSIAGIKGDSSNTFSYATSKAAVHQLTRNMAFALANDKVRVNAIAPGRFHSKMTEVFENNKAVYDAEIKAIPLHRWGHDEDIMGIALLLASRAGAFITGEIITVDGGTTLI